MMKLLKRKIGMLLAWSMIFSIILPGTFPWPVLGMGLSAHAYTSNARDGLARASSSDVPPATASEIVLATASQLLLFEEEEVSLEVIDDSGELKDLAGIEVEWYNDYAVSEDERTGAVLVTDSMGIASGMAVSGRTGAWKLSVDTLPEGYTADRIKSVWGKAEKDVVIHINKPENLCSVSVKLGTAAGGSQDLFENLTAKLVKQESIIASSVVQSVKVETDGTAYLGAVYPGKYRIELDTASWTTKDTLAWQIPGIEEAQSREITKEDKSWCAEYEIIPAEKNGSAVLHVTDESGVPLGGVQAELFYIDGTMTQTTGNAIEMLGTFTSDESGIIEIDGLYQRVPTLRVGYKIRGLEDEKNADYGSFEVPSSDVPRDVYIKVYSEKTQIIFDSYEFSNELGEVSILFKYRDAETGEWVENADCKLGTAADIPRIHRIEDGRIYVTVDNVPEGYSVLGEENSFSYDLLHGETSSAYDNAGSAKIYRIQMPVVKMQADQGFLRFPVSDVEYELWTGIDESEDGEIIFEYEMVCGTRCIIMDTAPMMRISR